MDGSSIIGPDKTRQIVALLSDDARRRELAEAGLARAAAYDWDGIVARYDRVYDDAIGGRR